MSKILVTVKTRELVLKFISIPIILLIWYGLSVWLGHFRFPSPITVMTGLFTTLTESQKLSFCGAGNNGFYPHIIATFLRVTLGYTFGSLIGLFFGILMKMSIKLDFFMRLPLDILRSIPPIALVPIFFMVLGRSLFIQILAIVIYSFLTIIINTLSAIENVPPIYQRYAMTLGASRIRVYSDVILPSIIPELLGAFRVGIIWAWGYEIIIEMMGSMNGIGKVFFYTKYMNALDLIFIGAIWVVILAGITDILLNQIFKRATKWQEKINQRALEIA